MLSVVIPTYRKADELKQTLAALIEPCARMQGEVEIIVVDDGSADGETRPVIETFARELPMVDASSPDNIGRARARNRGWKVAKGESVLFLDDDIVLEPRALSSHLRAQTKRPGVYIGTVLTAPEVIDSTLFAYLDSRGVAKCPPGSKVPSKYFLTQNASVPKRALDSIGGFDEHFDGYGFEDMEIAFRLENQCKLGFHHLRWASGQHVHHHTLEEYLEKKRMCGQTTLRQIGVLHPDRVSEMRLDVLRQFGGKGITTALMELSWKLAAPKLFQALLERWPATFAPVLTFKLYDYLVMSAYAQGLEEVP